MTRQVPITVLIADDHPVVRQGLAVLLEVQDDICLVGEASDGPEAVRLTLEHRPDVLLLDLKLPVLDGIGVLTRLREHAAATRVLVLTSAAGPAGPARAAGRSRGLPVQGRGPGRSGTGHPLGA